MDDPIESMQIAELDQHANHRAEVINWLHNQWPESTREEFDEALRTRSDCPPTMIAIYRDRPIGVIAFKLFTMKSKAVDDMWINALYVESNWRGRGVGSHLVEAGVHAAKPFGRSAIYVNTDIPRFYERKKWQWFGYNQETDMHVLEYRFD